MRYVLESVFGYMMIYRYLFFLLLLPCFIVVFIILLFFLLLPQTETGPALLE